MMKKLLSASLFAFVAFQANAWDVNDFVYTKNAKFQITGTNLVTNGQFKEGATGLDGWTASSETSTVNATFTSVEGAPNGSSMATVNTGMNALENGMYQQIKIDKAGTYVVSFQVMGASAGYTDLDMTGASANYINAYYNFDGALATVDGTNLLFGENGVGGGYQFDFTADGFNDVHFAVEAPADGYIMIDFRALVDGLSIANVECHEAKAVYDDRIAKNRIAFFEKIFADGTLADKEFYEDFQAIIADVEAALESGAAPDKMAVAMETLEMGWEEFVSLNFYNMIDFVETTDGSSAEGDNSANWMKWTKKWNSLAYSERNGQYTGKAPWTWTTDRWCHKTAAENSPMQIQWQAKASGNWNNIATLTTTLKAGVYYWGVTGVGGMMTLNKTRWARSWANPCANTQLFFTATGTASDTTEIFVLDPAVAQDYVYRFELTEEKEVQLGIICNTATDETKGFDIQFTNPVLYTLKGDGLTPEQEAYLSAVATQLDALKGRIDVANGYLSAENDTLPWGKEDLQVGVTEAQARYDVWAAMTQDEILAMMENYETLGDTIMNNGVRFLNNNYINPFVAKNAPLTDMPAAVEAAEATLGQRIYSGSSLRGDLEAKIAASEAMYNAKLTAPFSSEDSLALVVQREEMAALVEEFKLAITATTLVDIDFGTHEAPAVFVTHEDPEGLTETYYTIDGAAGSMKFSAIAEVFGTTLFELGYASANDEVSGLANRTDSLGTLRVGNGEAVVDIAGAPANAGDIVNIKFDLYVGKLNGKKAGYKVLTAEGDTICGLYFSKYSGVDDLNTFAVDYNNKIDGVGSSSASNAAIAASSNKTTFDIVLDYGARVMYCTTSGNKGTVTSEEIPFNGAVPAQFVVYSDYNNTDRRCWFDNLKVLNIAAEITDAIEDAEVLAPVRPTNGIMYNLLGQPISNPEKGQLYIQDGQKKIGK